MHRGRRLRPGICSSSGGGPFDLCGGEKAVPHSLPSQHRAGGQVANKAEGGDDDDESSSAFGEERETSEAESDQSWHPEQAELSTSQASGTAQRVANSAGAWYARRGGDPDGDPEGGSGGNFGGGGGEDGESEEACLGRDEEGFDLLVELAVDCPGGDSYLLEESRGMLWIFSQVPRRRLIVPGGQGCPWRREDFSGVRFSRCVPTDGTEIDAWEVMDDFRTHGNQFMWGPDRFWIGTTVFMLAGHDPPPDFPWACDSDDEPGGGGRPGTQDEGDWSEPDGEGAGGRVSGPASSQRGGSSGPSSSSQRGGSDQKRPRVSGSREDAEPVDRPTWKSFEEERMSDEVKEAAFNYVRVIDSIQDKEVETWRRVCRAGDQLLTGAGSVEVAAKALWIAREQLGMNNLGGVDESKLDELLPGELLAYLREVRSWGMPARFQGERSRVKTQPHPRARANMNQVYEQLMKDVAKHRVLVVDSAHAGLQHTISSPFEAVPKMLPNRTLSKEVRLVHDQRMVNQGTDKTLHPPAVQPMHRQIMRRILWLKTRFPGVDVLMAKKDVAGAFRLLWVDPRDVELFGGDVGWKPEEMGVDRQCGQEGDPTGMTMLYLVSSFGFSGSPGEWNVWGRATEELHRQHHPACARRDGRINFDGKILVDDMVLMEPVLGLRPWISSEVYEDGVVQLLGRKAVNAVKDAEEGQFAPSQLVWGVKIDAEKEKMSLPEARVAKGAHLLQGLEFSYGERCLTLKDLQRFRGIATGWATIVKGLKNELKAADRFLGGVDGASIVRPSGVGEGEQAVERAWEDLWALFEDCRWLCARSETWSEKFGGDIREMLEPLERLALPGCQFSTAVFVSSDATLEVLAAIDWTNGLACREELSALRPWIERALEDEEGSVDGKLAIHVGEMLSLVAFACKVGPWWTGKVVVYGGDNKVVYNWVSSRKSGVKVGRLLIRVLNLVEMRFRCQILGGWWRTFHNEDADALTRLDRDAAVKLMEEKSWTEVDIKEAIKQALDDTERFGPCFLSWTDQEDREEQMRLRELRVFRVLHRQPGHVANLQIVEWTPTARVVKDFEYYQHAGAGGPRVVTGSIGPDPHGRKVAKFLEFVGQETCETAVLEGPRDVAWDRLRDHAMRLGWMTSQVEFLTSELGEGLARRRIAAFLHGQPLSVHFIEELMVRAVTAPSLGSYLKPVDLADLVYYEKYESAVGQGNHAMLPVVGAHVWFAPQGERTSAYRLSGPGRWPLLDKKGRGFEDIYVVDRAAPAGAIRKLNRQEVWRAQGRSDSEWEEMVNQFGEETVAKDGNHATGRRTALALLMVAAEITKQAETSQKAGMCLDLEDSQSLVAVLQWLRRWRRGEYHRAAPDRRAGGGNLRHVWAWGEVIWIEALDGELEELERRAAGRRKTEKAEMRKAEQAVRLQVGLEGDMDVQAQVEEWLDDHMHGDQAQSTQKAYQTAWHR